MLLATTNSIEGKPVKVYYGIVTGETIIGANFVRDFFAGIRDIIGGRSGSYEKGCARQKTQPSTKWRKRPNASAQTP